MKTGEKLFRFLEALMVERFHGIVTVKFQNGKATHVDVETRRSYEYRELPDRYGASDGTDRAPSDDVALTY